MKFKKGFLKVILLVFLFSFSFTLHIYKLDRVSLYPDEITWMVRAKETALAIRTLNFSYFENAWWNIENDTEAIGLPLTVLVGFPIVYLAKGQSELSFNLFQDFFIGRWVILLISSFFIVLFYLIAEKLFNKKVALTTSLLLILDPAFTTSGRMIMNDSLLTVFVFISLASYLLVTNWKKSFVITSIALAGAFLTKPSGILVLPVMFLQIFLNRRNWKQELTKFICNVIFTFLIITILWPTAWHNPVFAIWEYLVREAFLTQQGINNYFFGVISDNPPPVYYLFQLLTKTPPLLSVSVILFTINFFRRGIDLNDKKEKTLFSILFFVIIYLFFISNIPKKLGIRYVLPIIPWLYMISGVFLVGITDRIKRRVPRVIFLGGIAVIMVINSIKLSPYQNLYYNFFVGGMKNARKFDLVGLCEGSREGVDYVHECYPGAKQIAVLGCGRSVVPYYYPNPFNENWKDEDLFVVEEHYLQLEKDKEVLKFVNESTPVKIIDIKGLVLSRVYAKEGVATSCD